jgi:hypothetical protein
MSWNIYFDDIIKQFDFIKKMDNPCVYKKVNEVVFQILYVDNILLIENDITLLLSVKIWLSKSFSMKNIREVAYILGIKIYIDWSRRLLGLSQSRFIDKMLKQFSLKESKRGYLSISHGLHHSKDMYPKT